MEKYCKIFLLIYFINHGPFHSKSATFFAHGPANFVCTDHLNNISREWHEFVTLNGVRRYH